MLKIPVLLTIAALGNYTLHFSEENGVKEIESLFDGDNELELNDQGLINRIIEHGQHNIIQTCYAKPKT